VCQAVDLDGETDVEQGRVDDDCLPPGQRHPHVVPPTGNAAAAQDPDKDALGPGAGTAGRRGDQSG
jgi:hypothetical protein